MRLCMFDDNRLGLVEQDQIVDVSEALAILPAFGYPPAREDLLVANLDRVADRARALAHDAPRLPLSSVKLLSPVAAPGKIIGAPVNYAKHLDEAREQKAINHGNKAHTMPINEIGLFLKASSSLIGVGTPIELSFPDARNDHEIELAVVIGRKADGVEAEHALDYVAGYTMGLDMTVRGSQDRSMRKSVDCYSVLGPWLVTADEILEPGNLDFELTVNGEPRQKANTRDLILNVAELIEFASRYYTLLPGDVIMTGTPEGVGPVVPGDKIWARMDGIGEMAVDVVGYRQ